MEFIGKYKEFCEKNEYPSIKDSFESEPYEGQDVIINYLKNGTVDMASVELPKDILTNEPLNIEKLGMNDGKYSWWNILAYYVEKYNLRLPKEFEEHILKAS